MPWSVHAVHKPCARRAHLKEYGIFGYPLRVTLEAQLLVSSGTRLVLTWPPHGEFTACSCFRRRRWQRQLARVSDFATNFMSPTVSILHRFLRKALQNRHCGGHKVLAVFRITPLGQRAPSTMSRHLPRHPPVPSF